MPWQHIPCHPSVRRAVFNASRNGMLRSTTVIFGQPGAGQPSVASAMAKTLHCNQVEHDFCGTCRTCFQIDQRLFPDVMELHPEGVNYKIDQIRQLQIHAVLHPFNSPIKVYILHDCHRMNKESFNSLLKILEEPYEHTVFLLTTDTLAGVLPTILSRCRKLCIPSQPIAEVTAGLSQTISEEQAETLARFSGGLLQQAESWINQNFFPIRDEVFLALQQVLMSEAYINHAVSALNSTKKSKEKMRDEQRLRLTVLLSLLRDAVCYASRTPNPVYIHIDRSAEYPALWKDYPASHWINAFEKTLSVLEGINRYLNMNALLTDLWITIQHPSR